MSTLNHEILSGNQIRYPDCPSYMGQSEADNALKVVISQIAISGSFTVSSCPSTGIAPGSFRSRLLRPGLPFT